MSEDQGMQDLAASACKILSTPDDAGNQVSISILPVPKFASLFGTPDADFNPLSPLNVDQNVPGLVMHSSGLYEQLFTIHRY